jgi:hypothetical protein
MYKISTLAAMMALMLLFLKDHSPGSIIDVDKRISVHPHKEMNTAVLFSCEKNATENWSQNWMVSAQENIRKAEYNIHWDKDLQSYSSPNRNNNLRFFYDEEGFSVVPRMSVR